jgi:hypothetical protein
MKGKSSPFTRTRLALIPLSIPFSLFPSCSHSHLLPLTPSLSPGKNGEIGALVDMYEHSLQTATRARRAGADTETVVCALLHDIGEVLSGTNHGEIPAALLRPYITPLVRSCARNRFAVASLLLRNHSEVAFQSPDITLQSPYALLLLHYSFLSPHHDFYSVPLTHPIISNSIPHLLRTGGRCGTASCFRLPLFPLIP